MSFRRWNPSNDEIPRCSLQHHIIRITIHDSFLRCYRSPFLENCISRMSYVPFVQRRKFFGKLRFFARRKKIPRNRTNDSWNFLGWKEKKKKKRRGGREGRRRRRGRGGWNVGRFFSWSKAPVSISTFQSLSNRSPPLRVLGIAARKVERNIISRINFSQVSGRIEGSVATGGEKVNSRVRHENPSFQSLQTLVKRITIFNLTVRPGTGDKRSFRVEDSS